jgi:hypothetical protein
MDVHQMDVHQMDVHQMDVHQMDVHQMDVHRPVSSRTAGSPPPRPASRSRPEEYDTARGETYIWSKWINIR